MLTPPLPWKGKYGYDEPQEREYHEKIVFRCHDELLQREATLIYVNPWILCTEPIVGPAAQSQLM